MFRRLINWLRGPSGGSFDDGVHYAIAHLATGGSAEDFVSQFGQAGHRVLPWVYALCCYVLFTVVF